MSKHLVQVDRDTPMLLPVDMREWIQDDDLVHFVIQSVETLPLHKLKFNHKGSGSDQYPPRMMLGLLIYCYSMGIFSSRRIQRATYRDVGVRYLTGDTHPDHDTICAFRVNNLDLIKETFHQVLTIARELGILKVGEISVDGTHIQANASKHKSVGYQRAGELQEQLRLDIDELMKKAQTADNQKIDDGQRLPESIARRENLMEKMVEARRRIQEQDKARFAAEQAEYEAKMARRKEREDEGKNNPPNGPKPPSPEPSPTELINLTDADSRLMRKSPTAEIRQAYNMQTAVDTDTMLMLATDVTQCANDSNQLESMVGAVDPRIGRPTRVLADTGYMNVEAMERLEKDGYELFVAVGRTDNHGQRTYDFRPPEMVKTTDDAPRDPRLKKMREKLQTPAGKATYNRRKETVEPVFGIIKAAMGFRQCLLRGLKKVTGEWSLVALAFNFRRLWNIQKAQQVVV